MQIVLSLLKDYFFRVTISLVVNLHMEIQFEQETGLEKELFPFYLKFPAEKFFRKSCLKDSMSLSQEFVSSSRNPNKCRNFLFKFFILNFLFFFKLSRCFIVSGVSEYFVFQIFHLFHKFRCFMISGVSHFSWVLLLLFFLFAIDKHDHLRFIRKLNCIMLQTQSGVFIIHSLFQMIYRLKS